MKLIMYRCIKILPVSIVPTIKIVEGVKNETNTVNKKILQQPNKYNINIKGCHCIYIYAYHIKEEVGNQNLFATYSRAMTV
jgi:hypothetical protein